MAKISAVILTKNEEKNIRRCLDLLIFCDEIIIIDDFSEDKTLEIINNLKYINKIKIYQNRLNDDFGQQRNFGLKQARGDWILFIDADEEVTMELKNEILSVVISKERNDSRDPVSFYIKRRDFWWGRELKFGEIPRWIGLIRLVKKNSGKWEGKVHEIFKSKGKIGCLKNHIIHRPHQTTAEFLSDINEYSTIRAKELYEKRKTTNILEIIFFPLGKFILNYFVKLGFLDGPAGFVYAFMMSFHSFLVRAKLFQFSKMND